MRVSFQYSHTIGRSESNGSGFHNPVAVARGPGDRLYVLNRGMEPEPSGKRITVCTVEEKYLGEFGRGIIASWEADAVASLGPLLWPTSIALDSHSNVYIADEWLNRISIFSLEGDFLGQWGRRGSGNGEVDGPSGIAFGKEDELYVVDSRNSRIQVFTTEGKSRSIWGQAGRGEGEFTLPWGIDVDGQGNVYVADWRNCRIQKFTADGRFLMQVGSPGDGEGELDHPSGVAVDKEGIIYVADWGNERLQVFDQDGEFITQMAGDASISKWGRDKLDSNGEMWDQRTTAYGLEREKLFASAVAVEVDDANRIFVADYGRSRIQVYRKLPAVFLGTRLGG